MLRREYGEEAAGMVAGQSKVNTTRLYGEKNDAIVRAVALAMVAKRRPKAKAG
jgi:hypothetical protein